MLVSLFVYKVYFSGSYSTQSATLLTVSRYFKSEKGMSEMSPTSTSFFSFLRFFLFFCLFVVFSFFSYPNSSCILMRKIGRERGKDREVREKERCTHMYVIICYLSNVSISIIKSFNT